MRAWRMVPALGAALLLLPEPAPAQVNPGDVLVTSLATGLVYRLDPTAPAPVTPVPVDIGGLPFVSPRGLAVDRNGFLLVTDNGPKTLLRVDPSRNQRKPAVQFSAVSSALRGVVAASDGRVFIADPGIVPLVEPPLPPIRGITYFPLISEVDVTDGFTLGKAVAGCDNESLGTVTCGNLYLPTGVAIASENPEIVLLVADGGDPAPNPPPARVRQGVIRVFPDRAFDPPPPALGNPYPATGAGVNDELFCAPGPFGTPRSLTVDRSPGREGSVLVTDSGDATRDPPLPAGVYRVPPDGCNVPAEVEKVALAQGLMRPIGIAVADDGTIFVADAIADTVFRIVPDTDPADLDGNGTGSISPFSSVGSIDQASDLQIQRASPGPYFVADSSVPALLRIDPAVPSREIVSSGGNLVAPATLDVLPDSAGLLVADPVARAVIEAALAGSQTVASQAGRLARPTSASREAGGSYLVTDLGDALALPPLLPAVIRVDPTQPSPGNQVVVSEGGLLVQPIAGAIDGSGFLIVADAGDGAAATPIPPRIIRIAPGPGLGADGQKKLLEGSALISPTALALDENGGVVLVADRGDATHLPAVLRLVRSGDPPGAILFALTLTSGELLKTPAGLAIDSDRSILVSDAGDAATDASVIRVDALSGFQTPVATAGGLGEPTGIGVRAPTPGVFPDQDGDRVSDTEDNCVSVPNTDQRDTDNPTDRIGNVCDPDYNNDGAVGTSDFFAVRRAFGSSEDDPPPSLYDPDLDADGDGVIGIAEFTLVRSCFGALPGVSALVSFDPDKDYCRPAAGSP